eukprot:s5_g53.t1
MVKLRALCRNICSAGCGSTRGGTASGKSKSAGTVGSDHSVFSTHMYPLNKNASKSKNSRHIRCLWHLNSLRSNHTSETHYSFDFLKHCSYC